MNRLSTYRKPTSFPKNKRGNDNLEQQAQALFRSWFVDFEPFGGVMPKDWKKMKLGEVCSCLLGGTPSRDIKTYWNGNIAWINSGEVNKFRITEPSEMITEEGLNNSATKLLPRKTTVIAITGATLGQVSLLEIESCANQSVIGILQNDILPYQYIYPYICEKATTFLQMQTGGAQQHINKNDVEGLNILVPKTEDLKEYKKITGSLYEQISTLCIESTRLASIRDTILPRMMSGELKVNEINA